MTGFTQELSLSNDRRLSKWQAKNIIDSQHNKKVLTISPIKGYWGPIRFKIRHTNSAGSQVEGDSNHDVSWGDAFIFCAFIRLQLAVSRPTITSYAIPWLLFVSAATLGACEYFNPNPPPKKSNIPAQVTVTNLAPLLQEINNLNTIQDNTLSTVNKLKGQLLNPGGAIEKEVQRAVKLLKVELLNELTPKIPPSDFKTTTPNKAPLPTTK